MELTVSWDEIVEKLTAKQDLSDLQITWAMAQILDGLATNDQIKNFLILLKAKGEKPSEVRALVGANSYKEDFANSVDRFAQRSTN